MGIKKVYVEELDKDVEVEIDVDFDDVLEYIQYEGSSFELREIAEEVEDYIDHDASYEEVEDYITSADMHTKRNLIGSLIGSNDGYAIPNTLEDEMKEEWWAVVRSKYSLQQLENVLGNRFQI